jgi:hypothetical protein
LPGFFRRKADLRHALLQHLHHGGWSPGLRLTDRQVNVLRRDDVADERELIAGVNLAKNLDEDIPRVDAAGKNLRRWQLQVMKCKWRDP